MHKYCSIFQDTTNFVRIKGSDKLEAIKVTGIRPMAPVQNRGPLEDIWVQNVKFFGKERNYCK